MAKLIVYMALAVWLAAALAIIARANFSLLDCLPSKLCSGSRPIDEIISKEFNYPERIKQKELKLLAKFYFEQLPQESSIEISGEKVKRLMEELSKLESRHAKLNLTDLGMPTSWVQLLSLRKNGIGCNEYIIHQVADYASQPATVSNVHQYNYALEHFGDYLQNCRHEELFRQMIENIQPKSSRKWDYTKYPKLRDYLVAEFWSRLAKGPSQIEKIEEKLTTLLLAIKELSQLESISSRDCNKRNLMANMINWQIDIRECSQFRDIVGDYFRLYLDTCGDEKTFEVMKQSIKQSSIKNQFSVKYETFNVYLKKEFFPTVGPENRDSAIREMDNLLWVMQSGRRWTDCTDHLMNRLTSSLVNGDRSSLELVKIRFVLYLEECDYEQSFKKAIDYIEEASHGQQHWNWDKYSTLSIYLEEKFFTRGTRLTNQMHNDLINVLFTIKGLSVMQNDSQHAGCTEQLKTSFLRWLENSNSYPELQKLVKGYFALYLDRCGFEERFRKVKMQHEIFEDDENLATYLFANSPTESGLRWRRQSVVVKDLLSTLNVVDNLADFGQFDGSNCNSDTTHFIKGLKSVRVVSSNLERDLDVFFANNIRVCADHFKVMTKRFQQENEKEWAFIEESTNLMKPFMEKDSCEGLWDVMCCVALKKDCGPMYRLDDHPETEDFQKNLRANCEILLDYMHKDIDIIYYGVNLAKEDGEVKEFMNYLSCCALVSAERNPEMESMFEKIGTPFHHESYLYSTKLYDKRGLPVWRGPSYWISGPTASPKAPQQETKEKSMVSLSEDLILSAPSRTVGFM